MCVNNLPRVALDSGEARIQTCDRKFSDLTTRATEPHRTSYRLLDKSREWTCCVRLEWMKLGTPKLKFDTLTDVQSTNLR